MTCEEAKGVPRVDHRVLRCKMRAELAAGEVGGGAPTDESGARCFRGLISLFFDERMCMGHEVVVLKVNRTTAIICGTLVFTYVLTLFCCTCP